MDRKKIEAFNENEIQGAHFLDIVWILMLKIKIKV